MKRLIVVAAGTAALMSGVAFADGGCSYGKHLASDQTKQSPVIAAIDEAEALRLEELKSIEDQVSNDKLMESLVFHN